eukprot:GILI01013253.1.p1 GENE.GILI01013253.1~~GILI01013253.1.p1  ORF type:complete len:526 (+),score=123.90 GILI01013253.1:159-1736(+)
MAHARLRVLNLNVFAGKFSVDMKRVKEQVKRVQSLQPDVVCLQECWDLRIQQEYIDGLPEYELYSVHSLKLSHVALMRKIARWTWRWLWPLLSTLLYILTFICLPPGMRRILFPLNTGDLLGVVILVRKSTAVVTAAHVQCFQQQTSECSKSGFVERIFYRPRGYLAAMLRLKKRCTCGATPIPQNKETTHSLPGAGVTEAPGGGPSTSGRTKASLGDSFSQCRCNFDPNVAAVDTGVDVMVVASHFNIGVTHASRWKQAHELHVCATNPKWKMPGPLAPMNDVVIDSPASNPDRMHPVIICVDTNADEIEQEMQYLFANGWHDTVALSHTREPTWDNNNPLVSSGHLREPDQRLDYVLYTLVPDRPSQAPLKQPRFDEGQSDCNCLCISSRKGKSKKKSASKKSTGPSRDPSKRPSETDPAAPADSGKAVSVEKRKTANVNEGSPILSSEVRVYSGELSESESEDGVTDVPPLDVLKSRWPSSFCYHQCNCASHVQIHHAEAVLKEAPFVSDHYGILSELVIAV